MKCNCKRETSEACNFEDIALIALAPLTQELRQVRSNLPSEFWQVCEYHSQWAQDTKGKGY